MELGRAGFAVVIGPLVTGLCDDAAVFPPGSASLPAAVRAHLDRRDAWYAALVGPLILPDGALAELATLVPAETTLPLSVTLPGGPDGLDAVRATAARLPVDLRSVEVPVAPAADPVDAVDQIAGSAAGIDAYVEIPRDGSGPAVLRRVAELGLRAKFRTGGVWAELYPPVGELAAALTDAVAAGVAFKATAGLHHAVRTTDPTTGFDQHGFLNLLLATSVLLDGGGRSDAAAALADRDGPGLATRLDELALVQVSAVRRAVVSYGTCSVTDPLAELVALGLITVPDREGSPT
ncbi:hypothetical protein [Pseudonocardia sp. HH130630-07]|uniref:hypothetical protein n=1 Tax=Pseudonocardia sp. HH130630-07 TaxID=1690815 RepID=UPI0018D4B6D6|nr:hypothetical protein [Pseudonocardia sp. HH130630-07]